MRKTEIDGVLSKGAEIGVFILAATFAITATVEVTARTKARDLIESEQKRVLGELVHIEYAVDAQQVARRMALAERARGLEQLEDSLDILTVNGSVQQNKLLDILDAALSEHDAIATIDSGPSSPVIREHQTTSQFSMSTASSPQTVSSSQPAPSVANASINPITTHAGVGQNRAVGENTRADDLSRSMFGLSLRTAVLPQRVVERLSSDHLIALAGAMCGVLGACIASLRSGRRQTFRNVLLGIGTGLIVFIGLRGGRTIFLLEDSSAGTVVNPYSSCFVALLGGIYSERMFAVLTAIVDKAAHKAGEDPA